MKNIIPTFPYEDSLNIVVSSKNRYNKKVGITTIIWLQLSGIPDKISYTDFRVIPTFNQECYVW